MTTDPADDITAGIRMSERELRASNADIDRAFRNIITSLVARGIMRAEEGAAKLADIDRWNAEDEEQEANDGTRA
jgi:hypothetical protein